MNEEPVFKDYKERQRYWKDRYENRGKVIHISKMYDHNGKVIQSGNTYTKENVLFLNGNKYIKNGKGL
jgi:hypothetical protein